MSGARPTHILHLVGGELRGPVLVQVNNLSWGDIHAGDGYGHLAGAAGRACWTSLSPTRVRGWGGWAEVGQHGGMGNAVVAWMACTDCEPWPAGRYGGGRMASWDIKLVRKAFGNAGFV